MCDLPVDGMLYYLTLDNFTLCRYFGSDAVLMDGTTSSANWVQKNGTSTSYTYTSDWYPSSNPDPPQHAVKSGSWT